MPNSECGDLQNVKHVSGREVTLHSLARLPAQLAAASEPQLHFRRHKSLLIMAEKAGGLQPTKG